MKTYEETMQYCEDVYKVVQAFLNHRMHFKYRLNPIYKDYSDAVLCCTVFAYGTENVRREHWCNWIWFNFYPGRKQRNRIINDAVFHDLELNGNYNLDDYMDSTESDAFFQYSLHMPEELLTMITLYNFLLKKKCKKFLLRIDQLDIMLQNIKGPVCPTKKISSTVKV